MKSLCLCMMLKNEAHIIKRCLESVKDIIDTYVICDTGSTDNTKEIIKDYFDNLGIKGNIIDHQWENFGVNRSMLLKEAKNKADYLLLVDGDYVINVHNKDFKSKLTKSGYCLRWTGGNIDYANLKLIKGDLDWKYFGPTHEYLKCMSLNNGNEINDHMDVLTDISITEFYDGGCRSDKFQRDIKLLLNEINKNPNDPDISRYCFYLGRSYEDLQDYENSLLYYLKRIEYGGWDEEVYFSMYKAGLCKIYLKYSVDDICESLLKAYNFRPSRLEALFELLKYCIDNKLYNLGYTLSINATNKPYPEHDKLFIDVKIHNYDFDLWVAICAYYAGKYMESIKIYNNLLKKTNLHTTATYLILKNMLFSVIKIKKFLGSNDISIICDNLINLYKMTKHFSTFHIDFISFCRNNNMHDINYNVCFEIFKTMNIINEQYNIILLDELSISSFYVGKFQESIVYSDMLLSRNISDDMKNRVLNNKMFSLDKINIMNLNK